MSAKLCFALYSREFAAPFVFGDRVLLHRDGILLREESIDGVRYGEAAPLPGHSKESLSEIIECLKAQRSVPATYPPSLRFALSQLRAEQKLRRPVRSNALIPAHPSPETFIEALTQAYESGYRVFKLKATPTNLKAVIAALEGFSPPGARFRIDGNRSLSFDDAFGLTRALSSAGLLEKIDYLEEPCPNSFSDSRMKSLAISIAADESAQSPADVIKLLESTVRPDVIVIKPALFGDLDDLRRVCGEIRNHGVRVIFSSALETEVGRRGILCFLGDEVEGETHGLSTGFLFKKSYWSDVPRFDSIPDMCADEEQYLNSLNWVAVQ